MLSIPHFAPPMSGDLRHIVDLDAEVPHRRLGALCCDSDRVRSYPLPKVTLADDGDRTRCSRQGLDDLARRVWHGPSAFARADRTRPLDPQDLERLAAVNAGDLVRLLTLMATKSCF